MQLFISIISAIAAIFIIILLHEMGHFFVARAFGIKILKFSIGFGKAIYKRVGKDGTEYVLAIIPLGGYVKMLGEHDAKDIPESELDRSFNRKPLYARMAVVLAGPATNFVLAILVFWAANLVGVSHVKPIVGQVIPGSYADKAGIKSGDYILKVGEKRTYNWQQVVLQLFLYMGDARIAKVQVLSANASTKVVRNFDLSTWKINKRKPEVFRSIGMFPYLVKIPPVIAQVLPHSPAAKAGLHKRDKIIQINGKPIDSWGQVIAVVSQLPGEKVKVKVKRGQSVKTVVVTVGHQPKNKARGFLGVAVKPSKIPENMIYTERYNVVTAVQPALVKTWELFKYNLLVLEKLISAKLSFKVIGGPISIFQAAGQAGHAGIEVYLGFIGFISLAVGFINLLPIPGLDGGHFLFQVIEAIIRRPVPDKIQAIGFTLGMLFVVFVMVNATINDLYRLLG